MCIRAYLCVVDRKKCIPRKCLSKSPLLLWIWLREFCEMWWLDLFQCNLLQPTLHSHCKQSRECLSNVCQIGPKFPLLSFWFVQPLNCMPILLEHEFFPVQEDSDFTRHEREWGKSVRKDDLATAHTEWTYSTGLELLEDVDKLIWTVKCKRVADASLPHFWFFIATCTQCYCPWSVRN